MNRRLIVRPEAEADITNGALWYEAANLGLGWRLFRKFIRQSREPLRTLNPLRVFGEI